MGGMSAIDDDLRAMGVLNWTLSRGSLESDELHLSFYVPTGAEPPALALGDEFEAGGWCGWVWDVQDGERTRGGRTVEVTVKGVIAYLDSIPCPLIERDGETELVSASSILSKAAAAASAAGCGLRWSGVNGSVLTVPAGSSDSVWGVVRGVLKWMPDVQTAQEGRVLVIRSGGEVPEGAAAVAQVKLRAAARGVLRVAGAEVNLTVLHDAEAGVYNWSASMHELVARALAGHDGVSASARGGVLTLTARVAGTDGNRLELAYTPADGEAEGLVSLVGFAGGVDGVPGESEAGVSAPSGVGWEQRTEWSAAQSMDDRMPPVVACRGGVNFEIPSGASIYQPGAFVYPVPYRTKGDRQEESKQQQRRMQAATGQWMHVKGLKVPKGWKVADGTAVNMRAPADVSVAGWRNFWMRFEAFKLLQKVGVDCLAFGTPVFEQVPAEEAYPEAEDGFAEVPAAGSVLPEKSDVPANYVEFTERDAEHFYVLREGSFPASSDKRGNVRGLKFSRGSLLQYVWLASPLSGTASAEEAKAFFSGQHVVGGKTKHYALLRLDAVFINRKRTRYQTGTNRFAPDDPDYQADLDADLPAAEPTPDYYGAMSQFWQSCQRAKLGGRSVSVYGVRGIDPASISLPAVQRLLGVEGDACRMTWDAGARTLTLQTGRRDILGVDELLNRQMLGRRSAEDRASNDELGAGQGGESWEAPPEVEPGDEPGGADEAVEGFPMVSPSVNASQVAAKEAKAMEPFALYQDEEGKWWINGGVIPAGRGHLRVEPKLVTVEVKDGRSFAVKARWDEASKSYKPKYIYFDEQ